MYAYTSNEANAEDGRTEASWKILSFLMHGEKPIAVNKLALAEKPFA